MAIFAVTIARDSTHAPCGGRGATGIDFDRKTICNFVAFTPGLFCLIKLFLN